MHACKYDNGNESSTSFPLSYLRRYVPSLSFIRSNFYEATSEVDYEGTKQKSNQGTVYIYVVYEASKVISFRTRNR